MKLSGMYENVRSCIRVCEGLSDVFEISSVYTGALCSVHCSSSSCMMLCHGRLESFSCLGTELLCLPLQGKGGCSGPRQL